MHAIVANAGGAPRRHAPLPSSKRTGARVISRSNDPGTLSNCHPRAPRAVSTWPGPPMPPQTSQVATALAPVTSAATNARHRPRAARPGMSTTGQTFTNAPATKPSAPHFGRPRFTRAAPTTAKATDAKSERT